MNMTTNIKFLSILFILFLGTCLSPKKASAQGATVGFQVFYDDLSPYGTWIDNPDYGYVWVPNVGSGFAPYSTNGYWVMTDEGWTWVSNYSWGWAPFHYGRWYTDPYYGPIWVPGNEWGPGWVTWRRSDDYYGWAPIGPGISIEMAYSDGYNVPYDRWRFVRCRDFGRSDIHNYYANSSTNVTIIKNTTVINNIHINNQRNSRYNAGPERGDVEKHIGKPVTQVAIADRNSPGHAVSKDHYEIYRPRVQKNTAPGSKEAPSKVVPLKEVKPPAQRGEAPRQNTNQPAKQQAPQQQAKPSQNTGGQRQPQQTAPPVKQQPSQPQHTAPPVKQQPSQPQHNAPPVKQQPSQKPQQNAPPKQQPSQPQHNAPPVKQQPSQPQHNAPPQNQQPQRNAEPPRQQPTQQPSQPQQANPKQEARPQQNKGEEKHPR
jgi:hypothetical protein